jgi:hypothetical protein
MTVMQVCGGRLRNYESVYRCIALSQGGLGVPGFLKRYPYALINTLVIIYDK